MALPLPLFPKREGEINVRVNQMPECPKRAKGNRNINCEFHSACFDIALAKGWDSLNCEGCPTYNGKQTDKPTPIEKKERTRMCEECGERPTIHPNSLYCARCMAKRSHAKRVAKEKAAKQPKREEPPKS